MATKIKYELNSTNEQNAFRALYKLKDKPEVNLTDENGTLYEGEIKNDVETIVYEGVEYFCGDESRDNQTTTSQSVTDTGFSWFRAIRREPEDDKTTGAKKWKMLLTDVPQKFFDRYPILIYDKEDERLSDSEIRTFERRLKNLMTTIFDGVQEQDIKVGIESSSRRTFYGASLRLDLSTGGEPFHVVARIFFGETEALDGSQKTVFHVLNKQQAASFAPENNALGGEGQTDAIRNDEIQNEINGFKQNGIKDFFQGLSERNENLYEYLVFSEEDLQILRRNIKDAPGARINGKLTMSCTKIEVKLCMKIAVNVPKFDIRLKCGMGEKVLTATSFAQLVTLQCDCGTELIKDNRVCTSAAMIDIKFEDDENTVRFDSVSKGATTHEKALALAKQEVFSKHLYHITCPLMLNKGSCDAYVCNRDYVEVEKADGGIEFKCKDCPYSEIYMNIGGKYYDVERLNFDGKEIFVKSGEDKTCDVCGRPIQKGNNCALCYDLIRGSDKEHRRQYRKYRILLPLMLRLKFFGTKNICAEDQEYIVFMLRGNGSRRKYVVYDKIKEDWLKGKSPKRL